MGFLQNHAIKKSCRGLAKELLNHAANHISQLPQNMKSNSFDQLMLSGLKNFVDTFQVHPGVNLDFKSIKYTSWQELYHGILIKGVCADLSYDLSIGTDEHKKLIIEIGRQVFDSSVNTLRNS
jgi:hypothetical protein